LNQQNQAEKLSKEPEVTTRVQKKKPKKLLTEEHLTVSTDSKKVKQQDEREELFKKVLDRITLRNTNVLKHKKEKAK